MKRDQEILDEINALWNPVYPFLADHLLAASGLGGGEMLDLGPFAGGIALAVLEAAPGFRATVLDEGEGVLRWVRSRAAQAGLGDRVVTRQGTLAPLAAPDATWDLVTVRGAFFFLTPSLLREIHRVLRPGGFAWVGGGYGPSTPAEVIAPIAERSKFLNEAVGKRRVSTGEVEALVAEAGLTESARVATEGGLWVEVRR